MFFSAEVQRYLDLVSLEKDVDEMRENELEYFRAVRESAVNSIRLTDDEFCLILQMRAYPDLFRKINTFCISYIDLTDVLRAIRDGKNACGK